MSNILKILQENLRKLGFTDFLIICGAGLLFWGIYAIYIPAALIFAGLFLIGWAVFIEYNGIKK